MTDQALCEQALDALKEVLATEYTVQVGGHDVECRKVHAVDGDCTCRFDAAREKAYAVLDAAR